MSLVTTISALPSTAVSAPVAGTALTDDELKVATPDMIKQIVDDVVNVWDLSGFDIDEAARLFGYEGFDPTEMYRHVVAVQVKNKLSDDDRNKDLGLLLVLQHLKGNVTLANFKSLKPEAQNMVNNLFARWAISLKVVKEKKRTCTLPRLAASFPLQMAIIAKGNVKDYAGPYDSKTLPSCMKCAAFPALIPIGHKVSKFIVAAYNAYATDQHVAITKTNYSALDAAAKLKMYSDQLKFTDVSFQSTVMSSEGRRRAMIMLGVPDHYDDLVAVYDRIGLDGSDKCTKSEWVAAFKAWHVVGVTAI